MTPKISLVTAVAGAALALGLPAAWGAPAPDAVERAVIAREQSERIGLATMPDAFERAVLASTQTRQGVSAVSRYPDAFERAALGASSTQQFVSDSHDRVVPTSTPAVGPVSSGRDIEWPQIGVGFGLGIVLVLLLGSAFRLVRIRQLAH